MMGTLSPSFRGHCSQNIYLLCKPLILSQSFFSELIWVVQTSKKEYCKLFFCGYRLILIVDTSLTQGVLGMGRSYIIYYVICKYSQCPSYRWDYTCFNPSFYTSFNFLFDLISLWV